MNTRVLNTAVLAVAAVGGFSFTSSEVKAQSVSLADFTFESLSATLSTTAAAIGPLTADSGALSSSSFASALHASSATVYSSPAGNGSPRSLSANHYAIGDYFQFNTSSTGYSGVVLTFDQTGSSTGPGTFELAYSTDGTTFSNYASYSIAAVTFNATVGNSATPPHYSFDLSTITALNEDASLTFRLIDASPNTGGAINAGNVGTAGTGRVDNFNIYATADTVGVPEPTSVLLVGSAVAPLMLGRRRRKDGEEV